MIENSTITFTGSSIASAYPVGVPYLVFCLFAGRSIPASKPTVSNIAAVSY